MSRRSRSCALLCLVASRRMALVLLGIALAVVITALPSHGADARSGVDAGPQLDPVLQQLVDNETGGRLTTINFYSAALHRQADYLVYLPAGYRPKRRLPVFYLLHGMPGKPVAFTVNADIEVRLEQLIHAHELKPMILVFPDGRIDGSTQSDSEWANTPSGDYESYVMDVVADVDQRFATLACRQERAIGGLSAGAYGAINIGLHQDPSFGLIQVWSGYFVETHNGVFAHADRTVMRYNSPLYFVRTLRSTLKQFPLRAFLYAGRDEVDAGQVPGMARALKRAGARESWTLVAGGHDWRTWTPRVDRMLIMASRDFARPLGGAPAACTAVAGQSGTSGHRASRPVSSGPATSRPAP